MCVCVCVCVCLDSLDLSTSHHRQPDHLPEMESDGRNGACSTFFSSPTPTRMNSDHAYEQLFEVWSSSSSTHCACRRFTCSNTTMRVCVCVYGSASTQHDKTSAHSSLSLFPRLLVRFCAIGGARKKPSQNTFSSSTQQRKVK